jgi:hypothetical protein
VRLRRLTQPHSRAVALEPVFGEKLGLAKSVKPGRLDDSDYCANPLLRRSSFIATTVFMRGRQLFVRVAVKGLESSRDS